MGHLETSVILLTAIGLSMDAFAVAMASSISLGRVTPRQLFRFSFHFGLFQAFMPVLGWSVGRVIPPVFAAWDHWVAFALLSAVGLKAIHESLKSNAPENGDDKEFDPTRGLKLVALSVATSLDAFAVGLGFAMLGVEIFQPCLIIGLVTAKLTLIGMLLGSRIGARMGQKMEIAGGLILIAVGLKIIADHLIV
jgi:putative Mn2+ efflux pump MntP